MTNIVLSLVKSPLATTRRQQLRGTAQGYSVQGLYSAWLVLFFLCCQATLELCLDLSAKRGYLASEPCDRKDLGVKKNSLRQKQTYISVVRSMRTGIRANAAERLD